MTNTFFDEDSYRNDMDLKVNEDVLKRIYNDNIQPSDKLPIEFFFLTDSEAKAILFKNYIKENFHLYVDVKVSDYEDDFEISGITDPREMNLTAINKWNQEMWDLGYQFDCKLDGWQVGI